jgi:endonuclease/exonuclease/phosphatase (EEP) superfamily protein YafD
VLAWDARASLVALNALAPALFLPAWPVAVLAGLGRRWALAGAAAVVVVAQLALLAPELLARRDLPALPVRAPRLRLFNANVYAGNPDMGGLAAEIRAAAPDVVFLQEASPAQVAALDQAGALAELPHRVTLARTDPFANALASRWPLLAHDVIEVDGRPIAIRATVEAAGARIRLYSVHVVSPFGGNRQAWVKETATVADAVRGETHPVLVGGDFNATWGHRVFRRLLDAGLTDAAAARGRPFQMTWPQDRHLLPPLTRIDHVMTTDGLAVTAVRTGAGRGSDHRPIVADVAPTRMGPAG